MLKPRGIPHTFWNPDDKPVRLVEIISAAGFEQFFDEASNLFLEVPPDVRRVLWVHRELISQFLDIVPDPRSKCFEFR